MLYNKKEKRVKTPIDCFNCKYYDRQTKECKGIGKNCFLYDEKTKTVIDPITHLPIKFK